VKFSRVTGKIFFLFTIACIGDLPMERLFASEDTGRIHISSLNKPANKPAEKKPTELSAHRGIHPMGLRTERDAYLYVPRSYREDNQAPLVVLLHGAEGEGRGMIPILQKLADTHGMILLAPTSAGSTWDFLRDDFGPDVDFIERAIDDVFKQHRIDISRVAIGGFSDGASYALTLGITNGDLFTHILAYSPGFASPPSRHGNPFIFISHGTDDRVLPIDRCSRRLVPALKQSGYLVIYNEFSGTHIVPSTVASESIKWFLKPTRRADSSRPK
jgi:phospholipase/carboxylesterase